MVKAGMRVALPLHPLELDFLARLYYTYVLYILHGKVVWARAHGRERKGRGGIGVRWSILPTFSFLTSSQRGSTIAARGRRGNGGGGGGGGGPNQTGGREREMKY